MHDDAYIGGCSENNIKCIVMTISGGPSKSYSHLHIGEGWKQTDTSFPIALYVGSVSLANGRGKSRIKRDLCGAQNPAYGGTKISGDRPRGLSA